VDSANGRLEQVAVFGDVSNPSHLVQNRARGKVYAVHGDGDVVSVLGLDAGDGGLRVLQQRKCHGINPVHLALAPDSRRLVVSNFEGPEGGSVVVLPVEDDGMLGEHVQRLALPGTQVPHRAQPSPSKPHSAVFDPAGRYLLISDKGQDRVYCFRYEAGSFAPAAKPWTDTRPGAGPRVAAFHPGGRHVYVLNDLDSTVTACRFDSGSGEVVPLQTLSTLSEQHAGNSGAAAITLSPSGHHLCASNRGDDSIAVFAVDAGTGLLHKVEMTPSDGRSPRFCTLDPSGTWLYALNEDSDSICCFRVDRDSGRLRKTHSTRSGSPLYMTFIQGFP